MPTTITEPKKKKTMPTPNDGEPLSDFMDRCMLDPGMITDFPDQETRIVMCQTQSEKHWTAPKRQGMQRAYSVLTWKAVQDDRRVLEGIATTPTPDRYDDVVEPEGIQFALPLPLLYQHNSKQPIGQVTDATVSKDGIRIKAQIAAKGVATYIDEAWNLIKAGLIQGLSIGFRSLEESYMKDTGGFRYTRSEWMELSAVTIPANAEATITNIKSADARSLAALGREATGTASSSRTITVASSPAALSQRVNRASTVISPGASGISIRRGPMPKMPITQQISDTEAKRAAHTARMLAITELAGEEGRTFNESESEEFETLEREVKELDVHLPRLRNLEKTIVARAIPIVSAAGTEPSNAAQLRAHSPIQVSSPLPKGTGFARYVITLYNANGDRHRAAELARKYYPDMPELEMLFKAPTSAGTTFDPSWAGPLYPAPTTLVSEFMELLRPATILGRLPGLRRVPFNVNVPVQGGGGTFGWVGEAQPKPVSSMAFNTVSLPFNKVAGIVPMSKELMRFSTPSAEAVVTSSMVQDAAAFIDLQLVDPTLHASTGVNPPSLTDQVVPKMASGTSAAAFRADLAVVVGAFIAANYDPRNIMILMSANIALNMSLIRNALGQKEFPDLTVNGGVVEGFPVLVSQSVGPRVVFLVPTEVLLAEAGVEIDVSQEASLLMDTNPGASPVTTAVVSLYQRNLVAIRVEQMITWRKGRPTTCQYIANAVYSG